MESLEFGPAGKKNKPMVRATENIFSENFRRRRENFFAEGAKAGASVKKNEPKYEYVMVEKIL